MNLLIPVIVDVIVEQLENPTFLSVRMEPPPVQWRWLADPEDGPPYPGSAIRMGPMNSGRFENELNEQLKVFRYEPATPETLDRVRLLVRSVILDYVAKGLILGFPCKEVGLAGPCQLDAGHPGDHLVHVSADVVLRDQVRRMIQGGNWSPVQIMRLVKRAIKEAVS